DQLPRLEFSIVTFHRESSSAEPDKNLTSDPELYPNAFIAAARAQAVEVDVISERFRFDPRAIRQLRRVVARRQPDIVQTHMIKGEQVVLAVGRLSREKGQRDLVDAISRLRELNSALKFKLVIVGEGPERDSLERAINQKGFDALVLFIGHVEDISPYYAIADALALPSHSEGSPNVLLEAMAAGLPVVATAVGGVPEIAINEENALLVAPGDSDSFAQALNQVLTDPELARKLGRAAAMHVSEKFSPAAYVRSLLRVYQSLASDAAAKKT